jgi:hypothetical protein
MNDTFDYDRFAALDGLELSSYIDPMLNAVIADDSIIVPRDFLQHLYSNLHRYDDFHLIYALELGGHRAPDLFLPQVPSYLAHPNNSVACAALRVLESLPDKWLTAELVNSLRDVLPSVSFAPKHVSETVERLQQRLEHGGGKGDKSK